MVSYAATELLGKIDPVAKGFLRLQRRGNAIVLQAS